MKTFDFSATATRIKALKAEADKKYQQIIRADTTWQNEYADRGGVMESALTSEAQAASDRVAAGLRANLNAVRVDVQPGIVASHKRVVGECAAQYAALAEAMDRLDLFEREGNGVLLELGAPTLPRFSDSDFGSRASHFAFRAAQLEAPPPPPRPKPSALSRLDFSWLFGK